MLLEMHDICKEYSVGKNVTQILKNIDLVVDSGEYIAIMGPSGSGKTTLMNLIGCLDVPTSGDYTLNDRDITKCSDNELADIRNKEIGFVFQSFQLLPKLNALENVALPLVYAGMKKDRRLELARRALIRVGLEDRTNYRSDQLSGGQCQRVAIARALVGNPSLILADEPTGALDSNNGAQVMELFDELHKEGATIIMITHDINVAKRADRICYIRDGKLEGGMDGYEFVDEYEDEVIEVISEDEIEEDEE